MSSRLLYGVTLFALLALLGCATRGTPDASPAPDDVVPGQADADAEAADRSDQSPSADPVPLGERAEKALESVVLGTVLGGNLGGPVGAAAGAVVFGVYTLITGDVPLVDDAARRKRPRRALDDDIADELSRQDALEDEIEAELRRQEELLDAINRQETLNAAIREEQERRVRASQTDPLAAPEPPYERQIPESLFEVERKHDGVPGRVAKTLDADRDGQPEIRILFDEKTGEIASRAEDTNYDGTLDAKTTYVHGQVALRAEDTNQDGKPDRWTSYENNRGTRVEVDRDYDGRRDGFYIYENGTLAREEHDTNGDGRVDRKVEYQGRRRSLEIEDRDGNGKMDFWTHYDRAGRRVRIEKDSDGDGAVDVWEYYEGQKASAMLIARREEDLDADGTIDVTSHYKKGKLSRKEILNPDALP